MNRTLKMFTEQSRKLVAISFAVFLTLALSGCGQQERDINPTLTLERAKSDLRAVAEELKSFVPADKVTKTLDDWETRKIGLLSCASSTKAFVYPRNITLTVKDGNYKHAVLEAAFNAFKGRKDWLTKWDTFNDPPTAVEFTNQHTGMYISLNFVNDKASIIGFSECFAGKQYNLLDDF